MLCEMKVLFLLLVIRNEQHEALSLEQKCDPTRENCNIFTHDHFKPKYVTVGKLIYPTDIPNLYF